MTGVTKATIRLFNYRCFGDKSPGLIELRPGFAAFIGPNNSGKSTLLRALRELRPLFLVALDAGQFEQLMRGEPYGFGLTNVEDPLEIARDQGTAPVVVDVSVDVESPLELARARFTFDRKQQVWRAEFYCEMGRRRLGGKDVSKEGFTILQANNSRVSGSMEAIRQLAHLIQQSIYIPAFRHAISGSTGTVEGDLLVGTEFLSTWAQWQTGSIKANRQRINQVVEDVRRLLEFDQLRVQPTVGSTTLQVTVDGRDYRLREIGAGLTQFLLVLATAAIKNPSLILIDEPELNLHPALQQDFLTALGSYCSYGLVFATHSIGLARTAADRVYSVQTRPDGSEVKPWESTVGVAELLGELSYSAYRETGIATVLAVEGMEDVRPAQQLLRLRGMEHSTLVVSVGGDRVTTERGVEFISELLRIGGKVGVLLDSERDSADAPPAERREWFVRECRKLGAEAHLTARRTLENYLTDAALKSVFGPETVALSEFQSLRTAARPWPKKENWRVIREMNIEDLRETDLMAFLERLA